MQGRVKGGSRFREELVEGREVQLVCTEGVSYRTVLGNI